MILLRRRVRLNTYIILPKNYHPCMVQFFIESTINFELIPKLQKLMRKTDFLDIFL